MPPHNMLGCGVDVHLAENANADAGFVKLRDLLPEGQSIASSLAPPRDSVET